MIAFVRCRVAMLQYTRSLIIKYRARGEWRAVRSEIKWGIRRLIVGSCG